MPTRSESDHQSSPCCTGLESDTEGVVPNGGVVELQRVPVVADLKDVLQRFQIHRPIPGDPARPAVVRGQRVVLAAEPAHLPRQVLDARLDIGVDPQLSEGGRHHLEVAAGAGARHDRPVAARLVDDDRAGEVEVESVLVGESLDLRVDLHHLPVHPEQARREGGERQQLVLARRDGLCGGGRESGAEEGGKKNHT